MAANSSPLKERLSHRPAVDAFKFQVIGKEPSLLSRILQGTPSTQINDGSHGYEGAVDMDIDDETSNDESDKPSLLQRIAWQKGKSQSQTSPNKASKRSQASLSKHNNPTTPDRVPASYQGKQVGHASRKDNSNPLRLESEGGTDSISLPSPPLTAPIDDSMEIVMNPETVSSPPLDQSASDALPITPPISSPPTHILLDTRTAFGISTTAGQSQREFNFLNGGATKGFIDFFMEEKSAWEDVRSTRDEEQHRQEILRWKETQQFLFPSPDIENERHESHLTTDAIAKDLAPSTSASTSAVNEGGEQSHVADSHILPSSSEERSSVDHVTGSTSNEIDVHMSSSQDRVTAPVQTMSHSSTTSTNLVVSIEESTTTYNPSSVNTSTPQTLGTGLHLAAHPSCSAGVSEAVNEMAPEATIPPTQVDLQASSHPEANPQNEARTASHRRDSTLFTSTEPVESGPTATSSLAERESQLRARIRKKTNNDRSITDAHQEPHQSLLASQSLSARTSRSADQRLSQDIGRFSIVVQIPPDAASPSTGPTPASITSSANGFPPKPFDAAVPPTLLTLGSFSQNDVHAEKEVPLETTKPQATSSLKRKRSVSSSRNMKAELEEGKPIVNLDNADQLVIKKKKEEIHSVSFTKQELEDQKHHLNLVVPTVDDSQGSHLPDAPPPSPSAFGQNEFSILQSVETNEPHNLTDVCNAEHVTGTINGNSFIRDISMAPRSLEYDPMGDVEPMRERTVSSDGNGRMSPAASLNLQRGRGDTLEHSEKGRSERRDGSESAYRRRRSISPYTRRRSADCYLPPLVRPTADRSMGRSDSYQFQEDRRPRQDSYPIRDRYGRLSPRPLNSKSSFETSREADTYVPSYGRREEDSHRVPYNARRPIPSTREMDIYPEPQDSDSRHRRAAALPERDRHEWRDESYQTGSWRSRVRANDSPSLPTFQDRPYRDIRNREDRYFEERRSEEGRDIRSTVTVPRAPELDREPQVPVITMHPAYESISPPPLRDAPPRSRSPVYNENAESSRAGPSSFGNHPVNESTFNSNHERRRAISPQPVRPELSHSFVQAHRAEQPVVQPLVQHDRVQVADQVAPKSGGSQLRVSLVDRLGINDVQVDDGLLERSSGNPRQDAGRQHVNTYSSEPLQHRMGSTAAKPKSGPMKGGIPASAASLLPKKKDLRLRLQDPSPRSVADEREILPDGPRVNSILSNSVRPPTGPSRGPRRSSIPHPTRPYSNQKGKASLFDRMQ